MSQVYVFHSNLSLFEVARRIREQRDQGFSLESFLLKPMRPTVVLQDLSLEVTRFERGVNVKSVFSGSFVSDHSKAPLVLTGVFTTNYATQTSFFGSIIATILIILALLLLADGQLSMAAIIVGMALLTKIISYTYGKHSEESILQYIEKLLDSNKAALHPSKHQ
jgi:VIT1/CCC1 family predicted Fe2+/Mn2+ transporter